VAILCTGVHAYGHAHTYILLVNCVKDLFQMKWCKRLQMPPCKVFEETFTYVQEERAIFVFTVNQYLTTSTLGSVTSPPALSFSSLLVQSPHHQLSPGSVTSPSALSWAHMWYSYHDSEIVYCKPHPHTMDCRCARVPRPGSLLSLPSLALWSVIALRKWKLKRLMKLYIGHPQTD
jgi:hypothetical protein